MWLEARLRADLRWIGADYSERYCFRLEATREFLVHQRPVVPYLNYEWFYDTRYDGWARTLWMAVVAVTTNEHFRFEVYLSGQHDRLPEAASLATDLIYLDVGGSKKNFRDFTLGPIGPPATVTADASLDITGWIWTIEGAYLVIEDPDRPMKLLAGARMLDLSAGLKWHLDGDISGLPLPGPDGRAMPATPSGTRSSASGAG